MNIFNRISDYMEEQRRRENREAAIILGGGCLVFIVVGIVFAVFALIFNTVETANVNNIYGETIAQSCQPVPIGEASIAHVPDSPEPRQIVLLIADAQRRHAWHTQLQPQWQAEDEAEAVLVGCVETESTVLETCQYARASTRGDGNYTISIDRRQFETSLTIINPITGRRIASDTVQGSIPDDCPEDDDTLSSGMTIDGSRVELDDFSGLLEQHIFDS